MFLKRLETVGFKSFAERIEIEFVPGVTAVVGPNGSGKSNIIDAVRWVLGEQSVKSLRGQKMEDIIFQGSDTRNQLNFAEVSLILNNETEQLPIDYQEVNITRRVYRSGESEFYINKQACRLRDIVDLFMDTGIGRESFSIIGQGKIDEILSSKAEDRRAIFEEAAGVLKYKQRKNKAVFKLTETEDNLDRVEDIIHEIKQQLEPLKEQADVAKKFKQKRAALKKEEIALLVTEIEALHEEWQALLTKIDEAKVVEMNEKTAIQKREATVTKARHDMKKTDEEMTSLQNELLTITEQIEQLEGKRNVFKERFKHAQENKHKLIVEQNEVDVNLKQTEEKMQLERAELQQVTDTIRQLKAGIADLEQQLFHGLDVVQEEIEDLKSDYIEHLNGQAVLQNEKQTIVKQQTQIEQLINREKTSHQIDLTQEATLAHQVEQFEVKLAQGRTEVSETETALKQSRASLLTDRKEYEDMQHRLYEGNEQIAKYISRKEMLEEMKESFQGFFYGVKEILKAVKANRLQHIEGVVIDLIDVPVPLITAIDTILGAQAQHIVVPNDEVARHAIQWLKTENKGRATFLPLQSISSRMIPAPLKETLQKNEGFIGVAADLVAVDERYAKVTEHLMGNVIVAKHLQSANELARMTSRRFRIVTLDGDVVYPGGSMSGGAKKKTTQSLFTREKEIVTINEKLQQFIVRRHKFTEKIASKHASINKLEQAITALENELQLRRRDYQAIERSYNENQMMLKAAQDGLSTFHLQLREKEAELTQLQANEAKLDRNLQAIKQKIADTEQTIDRLTQEQQSVQQNKEQMETALHELQVKVAEQEVRKKNHEDKINSLQERLVQLQEEAARISNDLEAVSQLEQSVSNESALNETIDGFKTRRQQMRLDIEQKQSIRKQTARAVEDEEREVRQLYTLQEKFVKEMQALEVHASRLDVTLENKLNFLQSEYIITYERAQTEYGRVKDVEAAKAIVKEIKRSISALGTVNLGSIEEYERLHERHAFLTKQQQDLMQAKETLFEVISEMDEEMIERFGEMFIQIQSAFTVVFKQLFGGGYAELKLTDPESLLETGIEIVARPPGKKLRSLELLSGGERALTAIALLFAILRARPIPFCILDEVDAALDEANVERFGRYLKSFSDETQFIVITHRKGTMEEADALYGVTMQESGVSRLVSVKLEDMDELVAT